MMRKNKKVQDEKTDKNNKIYEIIEYIASIFIYVILITGNFLSATFSFIILISENPSSRLNNYFAWIFLSSFLGMTIFSYLYYKIIAEHMKR
jgi:predicted membrane channel-forming protein YqfA (hemolysin III family)